MLSLMEMMRSNNEESQRAMAAGFGNMNTKMESLTGDVINVGSGLSDVRAAVGEQVEKIAQVAQEVSEVGIEVGFLKGDVISVNTRIAELESKVRENAQRAAAEIASMSRSSAPTSSTADSSSPPRSLRRRIEEVSAGQPSDNTSVFSAPASKDDEDNTRMLVKLTGLPHNYDRDERREVAIKVVAGLKDAGVAVPEHEVRCLGKLGKEIIFAFETIDAADAFFKAVIHADTPVFREPVMGAPNPRILDHGRLWWNRFKGALDYERSKATGRLTGVLHAMRLKLPSCDRNRGVVFLDRDTFATVRVWKEGERWLNKAVLDMHTCAEHGVDAAEVLSRFSQYSS